MYDKLKDELFQSDRSLLVVVDLVRGFVDEGALADPSIRRCVPLTVSLIEACLKKGLPILAFIDSHQPDAQEFSAFLPHCLAGESESELIDELKPYQNDMILLLKNSTNGFVQPQFLSTLEKLLPLDQIVICGCCTDICVLQFALTLKGWLNQNNKKTEVVVLKDATDTFDSPAHPKEQFNEMAYTLMQNAGIQIK